MRKRQLLIISWLALLLTNCAQRTVDPTATTAFTATTTIPAAPSAKVTDVPGRDYWPTEGWRTSTPEEQGMDSMKFGQIIDDIEDESEFRRGKPCTHRLFGLDVAINAGNAMYYLPLLPLIKNRNKLSAEKLSKIYEIYVREMINLNLGQAMDIAWHKGLADADNITERQYLQMCAYKTGTLVRMTAKIAAVLCEANENMVESLGRFAEAIGVAFQIQDDILDLTSKGFVEKKGGVVGQDITEGKRSLVVIHTLDKAKPADKRRLIDVLTMHTSDQKLIKEAIRIIEKYNSIDYSREFARKIVNDRWKEIDKLLEQSEAKENLHAFAMYLVERRI